MTYKGWYAIKSKQPNQPKLRHKYDSCLHTYSYVCVCVCLYMPAQWAGAVEYADRISVEV